MLDGGTGDSPDLTKIPLNTRMQVLFQDWVHWGYRLMNIFCAPCRNDPNPYVLEGSGCAVLAGCFISQSCGRDQNKVQ